MMDPAETIGLAPPPGRSREYPVRPLTDHRNNEPFGVTLGDQRAAQNEVRRRQRANTPVIAGGTRIRLVGRPGR